MLARILSCLFPHLKDDCTEEFAVCSNKTYPDIQAVVSRVHDGDTLTVRIPGYPPILAEVDVRISNIDTPELHDKRLDMQAKAFEARETLSKLIDGKEVILKSPKRDKYFRINATLEVDGKNPAEVLLKKGLARAYYGEGPKPW